MGLGRQNRTQNGKIRTQLTRQELEILAPDDKKLRSR